MTFCVLVFLLLVLFNQIIFAATDSLKYGDVLLINQTLVSNGGIFELGFFSFGKSPVRYYLGIWYYVDASTIVWVANRENPVTDDNSAYLSFTGDGNIGVLSRNGSLVWSSNVKEVSNATEAIMLDDGDFVLSLNGSYIWESFDNPTDTLLPKMKMRSYYKQGIAPRLTCWAAADDPSPGLVFIGFDPRSSLVLKILKGSETYWRTDIVNTTVLSAAQLTDSTAVYVEQITTDDDQICFWFTITNDSLIIRAFVDASGGKILSWNQSSSSWNLIRHRPNTRPKSCEMYNQCGLNGVCNGEDGSPLCKCLRGFRPKNSTEWNIGNYSSGCVKVILWECSKQGHFVQYSRMKVPDNMVLIRDVHETDCKANCTASCNCTAYLFDDKQTLDSKTRCLVWYDDIVDLVQNVEGTAEINMRVAASDIIVDSYKKSSHLVAITLPFLATSIIIIATVGYCLIIRHKRTGHTERLGDINASDKVETSQGHPDVPHIDFSHVLAATYNFSFANKIGEGGFGSVYKGKLQNGQEVAIKRLSKESRQGFEEFKNEVELIAKLQHTNLVKLLGWCNEHDEKILIYEYVRNGSLDKYLFYNQSLKLNWGERWQIIEGIAQGLLYLHRYSRLHVIHRDLKTSNILLDNEMNPKISDFGLARIFDGKQVEANTARVVGTYGYMSPEYALHGIFSDKSDVFSFGVILLEIVSRKRNNASYLYKDSLNLLGYVWQLWVEEQCSELFDTSIANSFSTLQMMRCIHVGLLCVQERPTDRPTMASIVYMLGNEDVILPTPGKPAFISLDDISCTSYSGYPQNEITMSVVEPR